jgi:hypothetical protein
MVSLMAEALRIRSSFSAGSGSGRFNLETIGKVRRVVITEELGLRQVRGRSCRYPVFFDVWSVSDELPRVFFVHYKVTKPPSVRIVSCLATNEKSPRFHGFAVGN